jgi:hypothetical protein
LNLLRLHALLTSGIDISSLADPSEISALFAISNILIGEPEQRQSIVEQFVRGEGEFEGTKCWFLSISIAVDSNLFIDSRLSAIIQEALNPPLAPSPVPVPDESVDEELPAPPSDDGEEEEEEEAQLPPVTVTGIPNVTSMSGSFQFIQQSEIETVVFETSSEWVEAVVPEPEMEAEGVADVAEPVPEVRNRSREVLSLVLITSCRQMGMGHSTGQLMRKADFLPSQACTPSLASRGPSRPRKRRRPPLLLLNPAGHHTVRRARMGMLVRLRKRMTMGLRR